MDSESEGDCEKNDSSKTVLQRKGMKNKDFKKSKRGAKKRHPSIKDARKSTLLIVNHEQNVKEEVEKFANSQKTEKGLGFHPIMVVVINERSLPKKFYVFVENLFYETESFRNCIETYIKSFWVFNLRYPKEGGRVCKFLLQLCFNLKSDDKSLTTIIKDLNHSIHTNK